MLSTIGAPHRCVTRCCAIAEKIAPARRGAGRRACRRPRSPPTYRSSRCNGTSAASTGRRCPGRAGTRARCRARSDRRRDGGRRRLSDRRSSPRCRAARARPTRRAGPGQANAGSPSAGKLRSRLAQQGTAAGLRNRRCRRPAAASRRWSAPPTVRELGIGQQDLRLAMLEEEGDRRRVEADVERVQHGAERGHGVVRFEQRRHVGRHHRDRIADTDAAPRQRRGEPAAARMNSRYV